LISSGYFDEIPYPCAGPRRGPQPGCGRSAGGVDRAGRGHGARRVRAKDIDDDWTQPADPRSGRNLAVGYGRAGTDYTGRGWSVGVFSRGDGFGKTNRDSIAVFQAAKDPLQLLDSDHRYDPDYEHCAGRRVPS